MSPASTLRFRRATAVLAVAWALVCLVLGVRGAVVRAQSPTTPFTQSGIAGRWVVNSVAPSVADRVSPGDQLLAVDGVAMSVWFRQSGERHRVGVPNLYSLRGSDGEEREVELLPLPPGARAFASESLLNLLIPLIGASYLLIALLVYRLKPERADAWALLLYGATVAAQCFLSGPLSRAGTFAGWMNLPFIGATLFHLFTTYPFEPHWVVRTPGLRVVPYGVAAALAAGIALEPWLGTPPGLAVSVAFLCTLASGAICIGILGVERMRHRGSPHLDRADILLISGGIAFAPLFGAVAYQYFSSSPYPWSVGLLGVSLFPAAIGYGIVRAELFDIRLVARSSAAYGAVTLLITGLFALLITFADAVFTRFNVNARTPAFSIAFLFFAILLFNPVRNRVQRMVDGYFDRDRAAYRGAVREISEAMVSMLSVEEIVERILVALTDTMGVERAMVLLVREGDGGLQPVAARGDWDEDAEEIVIPADHPLCRQLWMRRQELVRGDFDDEEDPEIRDACWDVFDTLGAQILVPVLYGVDLLGTIAVARKLSGERLGADDRQLMRTLANQSSIAIENAKAFDEIAQLNETLEARVDERTDELRRTQAQLVQSEKMRSLGQLVAGVAHELNNPIGFVHANLQLLNEYVDRLDSEDPERRQRAREAIRKLVSRSREGTQRVKQIVQDLRTFSRTDQATLLEADLNQEIERTLLLAEPRLKGGVEVVQDFGDLPPVRCYVGQLNQVFMNLIINACDAMDGKGKLTLRTRPSGTGVRLEFSDDGPGIPPDVAERLFEPFFTTKPVGQGTGLGLSLSHGIIERHGGRLFAEAAAGGGASFVIELPPEAPAPPEDVQ